MIKFSGLGTAFTRLTRAVSFGPGHTVHAEIAHAQNNIARYDKLLADPHTPPENLLKLETSKAQLQKHLEGLTAYRDRLAGEHQSVKNMAGVGAGLGIGAGVGGGLTYLGMKASEPDMGDDFKLAEWVSGFTTKCAEYGIDGAAWLESELDKIAVDGTIKNAQWGKVLGGLLAGGAVLGGAQAFLSGKQKKYQMAQGEQSNALALAKQRQTESANGFGMNGMGVPHSATEDFRDTLSGTTQAPAAPATPMPVEKPKIVAPDIAAPKTPLATTSYSAPTRGVRALVKGRV